MVAPYRTSSVPPPELLGMIGDIAGVSPDDVEELPMPSALAEKIAEEKRAEQEVERQLQAAQQYLAVVMIGKKQKFIPVHRG